MLPLPNLDDRNFEQLVREARNLIPGIFTDWTDENAHDPGITLLEMLAWHIEMQQYQLDRLTDSHERKFLKLLGEWPRDRQPATTSVGFSRAEVPVKIPYGTLLKVGELSFETVRPVTVIPDSDRSVFVYTEDGRREIQDDFEWGETPFYPFGADSKPGSSMELVLEEALPLAQPLSLWIQLSGQEPPRRIPARYTEFTPSARIEWVYQEEATGDWKPVVMERDESYGFHQSGPILFELPASAGSVTRIKAMFTSGVFHDPPLVRRLIWNEVFVEQGQTLCVTECFDGVASRAEWESDADREDLKLEPLHALFCTGEIEVQFKLDGGGWVDALPEYYVCEQQADRTVITIPRLIAPAGKQCIRIIAVSPELSGRTVCGRGSGMSWQACTLPYTPLLPNKLQLQVGWTEASSDTLVWHDWERVRDFDDSDPESYHYVIDEEEGVIRFSDGVRGAVPPAAPYPNIRLLGYRMGVGEEGNVNAGSIRGWDGDAVLQVTNLYPAYGGAEPESVRQALDRARLQVLEPNCGVTAEDIERRVMEIPGLRIARVKAIPGYNTTVQRYPEERAPGHTSIVLVPYSSHPRPKPSAGMIETVRRHLEPYRLLTTTFHMIAPEYVSVSVRAIIVADPRYEGREADVQQALDQWLQPYGNDESEGWEFGRTIYKSDVYDVIHQVPGILYIQEVWLLAEGKDVLRDEGGDIRIPPNGLVVSGEHEVEWVTSHR